MRNLTILLLLFLGANSFAQCKKYETLKYLFFDLDIDATDDVLVEQIEQYSSVKFESTGRVDTIGTVDSQYMIVKTPKVFGMPEYKLANQSNDRLNADSTFLFLGGGAGLQTTGQENENVKYYTIETVEINRYFSDPQSSIEMFTEFCKELSELLPDSKVFEWNQDNRSSYTISLSEKDDQAGSFDKQLVVEYYEFTEENTPTFIIRLSYEKQIPNEVI